MTTVPALGYSSADMSSLDALVYWFEVDMYIPSDFQIDRTMTVVEADQMNTNPSGYLGE